MRSRLALLTAAAALVCAVAAPSAQAAPKLKLGIYDCWTYNYSSGFSYVSSTIRFVTRKRYEHAFGRDGRKLEDKTKGTYRIKGSKITFKKGGMALTPARIKPADDNYERPYLVLLNDGEESGINCEYVEKP